MRKTIKILTFALLMVLLVAPVFAQTQGSLEIRSIQKATVLYQVADQNGVPTADFAGIQETNLTEADLTPQLAQKLRSFVQEQDIAGQTLTPNDEGVVRYAPLEQGVYLICSTAQPGEFAPFLVRIPMTIGGQPIYDIQAEPKTEDPDGPFSPQDPDTPQPDIPQTGNILWPKYLLLILGSLAILAGFVQILRGREKRYE